MNVNINILKIGHALKSKVDDDLIGVKKDDLLIVVGKGFSKWDGLHYVDCVTKEGYVKEIMKNINNFELIN